MKQPTGFLPTPNALSGWLKTSTFARPLILLTIAAVVIGGISLRGNADSGTAHDLYIIQSTLTDYYNHQNSLPDNLTQLHIKALTHDVSAYIYNPSIDPGGTTTVVELCANFTTTNISENDYLFSGDNNLSVYQHHRKGEQCFSNKIYKSQSHISAERT